MLYPATTILVHGCVCSSTVILPLAAGTASGSGTATPRTAGTATAGTITASGRGGRRAAREMRGVLLNGELMSAVFALIGIPLHSAVRIGGVNECLRSDAFRLAFVALRAFAQRLPVGEEDEKKKDNKCRRQDEQ